MKGRAALLLLFLPSMAVAQESHFVTAIPGKGILLDDRPRSTFIAQGSIAAGRLNTYSAGDLKNFCDWCNCCILVNAARLSNQLQRAGQGDLASDTAVLDSAVTIDLRRLPK